MFKQYVFQLYFSCFSKKYSSNKYIHVWQYIKSLDGLHNVKPKGLDGIYLYIYTIAAIYESNTMAQLKQHYHYMEDSIKANIIYHTVSTLFKFHYMLSYIHNHMITN